DKDILILDGHDQEVGSYEVGEIVISSEFLSPGYWANPELTAAAFRPDPKNPGRRRYHSGDLGVLLPDGCLLCKGRKDSKTKIHGIGVETAQLEAALRSHQHLQDAAVVVNEKESGEREIVAYVVPHKDAIPTAIALREFLADSVPAPMLPAGFVSLE